MTNNNTVANADVFGDLTAITDDGAGTNDSKMSDRDALPDLGTWVDHGMWTDAHNDGCAIHHLGQASHGQTGARGFNCSLKPQCLPIGTRPHNCRAGLALRQGIAICRRHRKRQIIRPRSCRFRQAKDGQINGAVSLCPQRRCNIFDSLCHISTPYSGSDLALNGADCYPFTGQRVPDP